MKNTKQNWKWEGFKNPDQYDISFTKLPHSFFICLPYIDKVAELKVVLYVLRHTWGYQEFDGVKRITVDEFMYGRKKKDGTRMDKGTGLSDHSIRYGIKKAIEHGLLDYKVDDHDGGRIVKYYGLNIREERE